MKFRIVKNESRKTDCEKCLFQGVCKSLCPLKVGFYFSDILSSEPDYMSSSGNGFFRNI